MEEMDLEQRMYAIVLYNLSPIQQGIQAQHAITEYAQSFFNTIQYQRWAQVDKTTVILNGSSSINLRKSLDYLIDNQIVDLAFFKEPDLFNGITAFAFLADERIWNREKYPDRLEQLEGTDIGGGAMIVPAIHRTFDINAFKEQIGGEKNFMLKEFLSKFRKA